MDHQYTCACTMVPTQQVALHRRFLVVGKIGHCAEKRRLIRGCPLMRVSYKTCFTAMYNSQLACYKTIPK